MLYKLVYIIYHWLRIVLHNTPVFICQWNKTLLKQAAICKGKLCINQTSKYQGLYIILQNTGVLYFSRTFVRKFWSPGIRFWTFPPKLYLLALFVYFRSAWCFVRTLHPDKTLYKPCEQLHYWKISVLYTVCTQNADISFHSSFTFSYSKMNISLLFTFFSDKLKLSVFICCIKVTRQN